MSVLGPLFIPRKQNITGHPQGPAHQMTPPVMPALGTPPAPDTIPIQNTTGMDLEHLEKALQENFLAIQRWANSAPRLAGVVGQCSPSATMNSNGSTDFFAVLPLDGPQNAFFPNLFDAAHNRVVIPQTGWYLFSANIRWNTAGNAGIKSGSVESVMFTNGNDPSISTNPVTTSGTSPLVAIPATSTYPSQSITPDFQTITFAGLFNTKDTVQLFGENAVFFVNTVPPGVAISNTSYSARIQQLSVEFLGSSPSAVQ